MKYKLIAALTAMALIHGSVFAEVDYSGKISELKKLIAECESEGYYVEYEKTDTAVFEMFEQYMNDDLKSGVSTDSERWKYNSCVMDGLYSDTKKRLNSYLSGKSTPMRGSLSGMLDVRSDGKVLRDKNGVPVFSVGFGHTGEVYEDINRFTDVGVNNVQLEIGPNRMAYSLGGWLNGSTGSDGTVELSTLYKKEGESSLKIKNTSQSAYKRIFQRMNYRDGATYEVGFFGNTGGNEPGKVYVSAANYSAGATIKKSSSWEEYSFRYTHSATENPDPQFAVVYDKVTDANKNAMVYLDGFYVYELNSQGKRISENLLKNPGFETGWGYDDSVKYITDALTEAEEENVGVCLLISPHYLSVDKDSDLYTNKGVFIFYNIGAEQTRAALEDYLENLLPCIKDYKALTSICISNEPVFNTMNFSEFYNADFRKYLLEKHGSLEEINAVYNSNYTDMEEISIPKDVKADAISYDWVEFNEKVFTEWHKFIADIVEEYLPEIPVHSKMMSYFGNPNPHGIPGENEDRDILARGTDLELFAEFSDYMGVDTGDYVYNPDSYYVTMLTYDYLQSVSGKPIYDSETHIIANRTENYNKDQLLHWRNNLWMGAVHGRSMATVWGWSRTTDSASDLYLGALTRPDIIAETGKVNLDFGRLSQELVKLGDCDTAIFYSKPSRIYNDKHMPEVLNVYKKLLNVGQRQGFVSDKSIEMLSKYKVLIMPEVTNIKKETAEQIKKFMQNGGKVIICGNAPEKDEYNRALTETSYITENGYKYSAEDGGKQIGEWFEKWGIRRVSLVDNKTGGIPQDVDWQYCIDGGDVLINVTSLDYENGKNISVYLDGKKLTNMTDLITGQKQMDRVELTGYTPMLLKFENTEKISSEIANLKCDGYELNWEYSGNTYVKAAVYSLEEGGTLRKIYDGVRDMSVKLPETNGTYIVRAVNCDGTESKGKIITVAGSNTFETEILNCLRSGNSLQCEVNVKNITENFAAGVVVIEVKDGEGNVIKRNYQKNTMAAEEETDFKLYMTVPTEATQITVGVYDCIGGTPISDSLSEMI